jgi:hypothetical protein
MAARSLIPIAILFAIGPIFLAATAVISTARFLAGATTAQASFRRKQSQERWQSRRRVLLPEAQLPTRDGR